MKVVIYSINYLPELIGIGKYNGEMAEWLASKGHDVTVITAPPYYPDWKIKDGYSKFWFKKEKLNKVNVVRCPIWVPSKPSGLKRILHLFSFSMTSFPVMLWHVLRCRPDIIFVVEPPFFCAPTALLLSKLCRAQSWLHIQDFEIDAAFDLGILKSERLRRWVSGVESWIMCHFDTVSTISVRMLDKLLSKGVLPEKTALFENWVDVDSISPMTDKLGLYQHLELPLNRKILLYSGNMGEKQGLEIILDAAREFSNRKDLLFLMCGNGAAKERLLSLSSGLENVVFAPLQPLDKLNELLNLADIHLLPQKAGAEDLVMPSKLSNMMASGKPVVATAMPDTQISNVLIDCGIVVEPGDISAFVEAIDVLVSDENECARMGENGRDYAVQHWGRENVLTSAFTAFIK